MDSWQHHFQNLIKDGEICFEDGDFDNARLFYQDAFKLIPEPKQSYDEATISITSIADCFYHLKQFEKALDALNDVLLCPGGAANPFVQLRRGQVYYSLGDKDKARTELTAAFLNGGNEVFEGEEDYLELISDIVAELPENIAKKNS